MKHARFLRTPDSVPGLLWWNLRDSYRGKSKDYQTGQATPLAFWLHGCSPSLFSEQRWSANGSIWFLHNKTVSKWGTNNSNQILGTCLFRGNRLGARRNSTGWDRTLFGSRKELKGISYEAKTSEFRLAASHFADLDLPLCMKNPSLHNLVHYKKQ